MVAFMYEEEEEEADCKPWPANKSDRLWQSLSNPAKCHDFYSNSVYDSSYLVSEPQGLSLALRFRRCLNV